eukprot:946679-Pelagomonas_calceolata.AAC.2
MAEAQAEVMKAAASTAAAVGFGGRCRRTMTSVVGSAVKLLWQEEWQKDWQRPDGPAGIAESSGLEDWTGKSTGGSMVGVRCVCQKPSFAGAAFSQQQHDCCYRGGTLFGLAAPGKDVLAHAWGIGGVLQQCMIMQSHVDLRQLSSLSAASVDASVYDNDVD